MSPPSDDLGENPTAPPSETAGAWRWTLLLVGLAAWALSNMDQSFFGYAVPGLMKSFNLQLPQIGWLISASFLFSMIVATLAGALTDEFGPKWTLPICLTLSACFVGLQGLAPGAGSFSVLRILGYGFSGALSPVTNAMVSAAMPLRHRPMAIAILTCGYPLGWFAASLLAAPLLPVWGWRGIFIAAFAVVPFAILFTFIIPKTSRSRRTASGPARNALIEPLVTLFSQPYRRLAIQVAIAFLLYGGAVGGITFYLPIFFQATRGYTAATAAQIVGLSYGIGIVGYVGSAYVRQTILSSRDTVLLWLGLGALSLLALLLVRGGIIADIIMFSLTAIFLFGSSAILIIYLLELFPSSIRASAAAVCGTSAIGLGFVIFPVITGALAPHFGWTLTFASIALPAVTGSAVLMALLPTLGETEVEADLSSVGFSTPR